MFLVDYLLGEEEVMQYEAKQELDQIEEVEFIELMGKTFINHPDQAGVTNCVFEFLIYSIECSEDSLWIPEVSLVNETHSYLLVCTQTALAFED